LPLLPSRRLDSLILLLDLLDSLFDRDLGGFRANERKDDVFQDDEVEREVASEVRSELGRGAGEAKDGFGAGVGAGDDRRDEEGGVECLLERNLGSISSLGRSEGRGDVARDLMKLSSGDELSFGDSVGHDSQWRIRPS